MSYYTDLEVRNDVDALLALASKMHYLAATSDLSEVARQTRDHKTVYDGTGVALEALLALKWPGVPVAWMRDLWIDLLDVPTQSDVESTVLNNLYRDPAFDPSRHACSYADQAVKDAVGEVPVGGWTDEVDAVWTTAHDLAYADQTKHIELLARDMSKPR